MSSQMASGLGGVVDEQGSGGSRAEGGGYNTRGKARLSLISVLSYKRI